MELSVLAVTVLGGMALIAGALTLIGTQIAGQAATPALRADPPHRGAGGYPLLVHRCGNQRR